MATVWSAVFVTEFILILTINAFTIIAFVRKCHLRKRSTYLIINLTVADLLVGAVTGPLDRYASDIKAESEYGFSWRAFVVVTLTYIFSGTSLSYLSLISLERLHATLYPFRHCLIGKRVYFTIIICCWSLALLLSSLFSVLHMFVKAAIPYLLASYIVLTILTLTVSYVIIIVKVRNNPAPYHFSSVASDRKLSITLFIVTVASILTILPWAIFLNFPLDSRNQLLPEANALLVLYYTSSLVNPLIYAVRMQQFRKAVKEIIFCKETPDSSRVHPMELPM